LLYDRTVKYISECGQHKDNLIPMVLKVKINIWKSNEDGWYCLGTPKNRWLNCGEVKIWHFPSPVFYFRADFISKNKTNYWNMGKNFNIKMTKHADIFFKHLWTWRNWKKILEYN
jgi:hypothetical protein